MKLLWDYETMIRTLKRITHEIIEREINLDSLILFGIEKKGVHIARLIQKNLKEFADYDVPFYPLNISGFRDDDKVKTVDLPDVDISESHVIIVDDVLYTGRTVRAAMDALMHIGRPKTVQLCVLIDRGHRELPIRADYVGKNVPTRFNESIIVDLKENKGVYLTQQEDSNEDD